MTVLEWLQELEEEKRIIKVGCVDKHPAGPAPLHRPNGRHQLPALGLPGIPCAAAGPCI